MKLPPVALLALLVLSGFMTFKELHWGRPWCSAQWSMIHRRRPRRCHMVPWRAWDGEGTGCQEIGWFFIFRLTRWTSSRNRTNRIWFESVHCWRHKSGESHTIIKLWKVQSPKRSMTSDRFFQYDQYAGPVSWQAVSKLSWAILSIFHLDFSYQFLEVLPWASGVGSCPTSLISQ